MDSSTDEHGLRPGKRRFLRTRKASLIGEPVCMTEILSDPYYNHANLRCLGKELAAREHKEHKEGGLRLCVLLQFSSVVAVQATLGLSVSIHAPQYLLRPSSAVALLRRMERTGPWLRDFSTAWFRLREPAT